MLLKHESLGFENFICCWGPCAGGLMYQWSGSNMQGVTSAAFLLTYYARLLARAKATVNCGGTRVTPSQLTTIAQKQVHFV